MYLVLLIFFLLFPSLTFADSAWKAKKSKHFTIFYREGYEWEVEEVISSLESHRKKIVRLTGNRDIGPPTLITLYDAGTFPNGYYDPIFDNIGIFAYPPHDGFPSLVENWYRMIIVHEYTHRMHITNTRGLPRLATILFGTLFHPNLLTPAWLIEGIAVYSESKSSPYEGRLNSPYFPSYLMVRAKEGRFPDLNTMTHSPFDYPHHEGIYLYGGQFLQYLATRYGEEKLSEFFSFIGGSLLSYIGPIFPYLGIDRGARRVYGKPIKVLFDEWRLYEEKRAKEEWRIDGERLTSHGWGVSYPVLWNGKLYYVREYPKKTGAYEYFYFQEILERDLSTGRERVVASLTSSVYHPLRILDDKLYYGVFEIGRGYKGSSFLDFGFITSIYEIDLKRGKKRSLFKDEIRSFSPISLNQILYFKDETNRFGGSFFIYSINTGEKRHLFTTPYLVSEILPTKDGIFVVARRNLENWSIYRLNIEDGVFTPLIDTPFDEINIYFESGILYFASNYENLYRIYAYNLEDKRVFCLTKDGYVKYPVVDQNKGRLYFVGLTSNGFDIFYKGLEPLEFTLPECKSHDRSTPFPIKTEDAGYIENLKTLSPKVHIPFHIGIFLAGRDAVGENKYILLPYLYGDGRIGGMGSIYSSFFKPSILHLGFVSEESLSIGWRYPLWRSLAPGLSYLDLSLVGGIQDGFKEEYIRPGVGMGIRSPRFELGLFTGYHAGSEKGRIDLNLSTRRYISDSHLALSLNYDPEEGIRPRSRPGISLSNLLSLEYSFPYRKIRDGFWNPNIYLEDLFLLFFIELSFREKKTFFGLGLEFRQELSLFLGSVKLPLHLGYGINREGEGGVFAGIRILGSDSLLTRPPKF